jgi:hypothetical protein
MFNDMVIDILPMDNIQEVIDIALIKEQETKICLTAITDVSYLAAKGITNLNKSKSNITSAHN